MARIAIDHVAIVVSDMEAALGFWQRALGLELQRVESIPAEAVDVAFLETENAHVELLLPTDEGSGIARYLAGERRRDAPHLPGRAGHRGRHAGAG